MLSMQLAVTPQVEDASDSEFEELVAEGKEEHPIVRYTRLKKDKEAELEYVYNPVSWMGA